MELRDEGALLGGKKWRRLQPTPARFAVDEDKKAIFEPSLAVLKVAFVHRQSIAPAVAILRPEKDMRSKKESGDEVELSLGSM